MDFQVRISPVLQELSLKQIVNGNGILRVAV